MPLYDLDWGRGYNREMTSFLYQWSASIAHALNSQLPAEERRFLAEMSCRTRLKTDELIREADHGPPSIFTTEGQDTGRRYPSFDPGPASSTSAARFTDRIGVNVIDQEAGRSVGAAILLLTPDNKSDSDSALAFAIRAAALISAGVGIVVVDIVPGPPSWGTHLHSLTGVFPTAKRRPSSTCPVLVVQPTARQDAEQYAVWFHDLAFGSPLPAVAVPVRSAMKLKLDLEASYLEACERSRIP